MENLPAHRLLLRPFRPLARRLLRFVKRTPLRLASAEALFTRIYRRNAWLGIESSSGPGSSVEETAELRARLPAVLAELGCRSLLDAPCGDFHWMRETALDLDLYVGADIVAELVARNRERHAGRRRRFLRLDIRGDALPAVDVILCRDGLVHFSNRDVSRALGNFRRSGSTYLLATTFPGQSGNPPIATGEWRPLNLELPPFNLPPPLRRLAELPSSIQGPYPDKCLALWRLDQLVI